jgi:F-type H+-transporting ATPase subunit b
MDETTESDAAHDAAPADQPGGHELPAAGEAHGTGTEAAGGHEAVPFPPFNPEFFASQLFWLVICFGLFYVVLKRRAIPQIGGILETRQATIAGDLAAAEKLKAQSDEALAGYEQALAEARKQAHGIAEASRLDANAAADAKRAATEAALAGKLTEAEASIAAIKRQALDQVGAIAAETTEALIAVLVKTDVSRTEIDGAVAAAMAH